MRSAHQALGAAFLVMALPSWLPLPEPPAWVERWLFNAEERTAEGLEALDEDDPERAIERFDAAARLASDQPLTDYNAGTARLMSEEKNAIEPLERAAERASATDASWAVDAHYNLGSAYLTVGDAASAVESFKDTLRRDPGHQAAKHNLELALRQLDQQPPSMQEPQPSAESEPEDEDQEPNEEGSEEESGESADSQTSDDQRQSDASGRQDADNENGEARESQETIDGEGEPAAERNAKTRSLPNFEQQPEMTAEQAAALLDAVDNLERQRRQEQARAAAQTPSGEEKDW